MKCKKCGEEINDNSKFCSECGEPVLKEESEKNAESSDMVRLYDKETGTYYTISADALKNGNKKPQQHSKSAIIPVLGLFFAFLALIFFKVTVICVIFFVAAMVFSCLGLSKTYKTHILAIIGLFVGVAALVISLTTTFANKKEASNNTSQKTSYSSTKKTEKRKTEAVTTEPNTKKLSLGEIVKTDDFSIGLVCVRSLNYIQYDYFDTTDEIEAGHEVVVPYF